MTTNEVSKYLRINEEFVYRLLHSGKLGSNFYKSLKGGKPNWFISTGNLERFLKSNEEYSYKKLGFGSLKVKNLNLS